MHPNLDLQNVLVDESGYLTGIVDWDGIAIVPRCVGWSTFPLWLTKDWQVDYQWPEAEGVGFSMVPDVLDRYRCHYKRYLVEASGNAMDCRFTSKSHIYLAVLAAVNHTDRRYATKLVDTVLVRLMPGIDPCEYTTYIGSARWPSAEESCVREQIRNLLEAA